MMNIWRNDTRGDDRIIAFVDNTIYKCNPSPEEVENYVQSLKMNIVPKKAIHGVPLSYISEIRLQEGGKTIKLISGAGSEDDLTITDSATREEIFEASKELFPRYAYIVDKHTRLQAGKKPLIALGIVTAIFLWTITIASGMEKGGEFDVVGGGADSYRSVAGLVLVIASLGIKKVMIIFLSLMALAAVSFVRKARNPPVFKRIIVKRG